MVKTERLQQADEVEPAPGSAWFIGAAAWFVPGLGHLMQKKWWRAALMGGAVWLCFFIGLNMGGHMFDLNAAEGSSQLLQVPLVSAAGQVVREHFLGQHRRGA